MSARTFPERCCDECCTSAQAHHLVWAYHWVCTELRSLVPPCAFIYVRTCEHRAIQDHNEKGEAALETLYALHKCELQQQQEENMAEVRHLQQQLQGRKAEIEAMQASHVAEVDDVELAHEVWLMC